MIFRICQEIYFVTSGYKKYLILQVQHQGWLILNKSHPHHMHDPLLSNITILILIQFPVKNISKTLHYTSV